MAELSVVGSLYGGTGSLAFSGITDFEFYEKNGQLFLLVASQGTSNIHLYYVYADQPLKYRDVQDLTVDSGTFAITDMDVLTIAGEDFILTSGAYDDNAGLVAIVGGVPQITYPEDVTGDAADYANFAMTRVVDINDQTYVLVSKRGNPSLYVFSVTEGGQFNQRFNLADDASLTLGDITDFATVVMNGQTYLAVTSAFDGGVTLFKMRADGSLVQRDTVFPGDGMGFTYPQDIEFVTAGGDQYLAMISSGTSTLTIYRVGKHGQLHEVDYAMDNLNTRFEGASQMVTITDNGRSFIFVAGNDDGLTVFELLPNGQLLHSITIEDNFDIALTNISALSVKTIDGAIHVFVGGAEDGITQFVFDPNALGTTLIGTTGKDVINGTAMDDYLFGGRRGDTINGGAGDDRIDGGGGKDFLTGGVGADTFVFVADGRKDFIMDFEDGIDLIDLSGYQQLGSIDDLEIYTRKWGVLIDIKGEKLKVIAMDGDVITADDFTADDFIFDF